MLKKLDKKKIYFLLIGAIFIAITLYLIPKPKASVKKHEDIHLSFATDNIDPEKIWRSYFEDKLSENRDISAEQISNLRESYSKDLERIRKENISDISNIKQDLSKEQVLLKDKLDELILLQQKSFEEPKEEIYQPQMSIINIAENDETPNIPFDRKSYIAETSYVTGILMGGIAVSTSIGSSAAPVPIIIRIINKGNFPDNFKIDLKLCRILGSAYGDLSSERAVIRAEMLICEKDDEIVTTKISGIIYGDDGMNGIRGRVIDMSSKHIKNAAMGGVLSAFSSSMKSEADISITPFGGLSQKAKKTSQNIRENSLKGAANAAEKIADYYIKKAENMSPILQIPGGTKVDVVFTKGAYLGSSDIVGKINSEKR